MKTKKLFRYCPILEPICGKITGHRHGKLILWDKDFETKGFKYPNRHEFYYKCKICGYVYWHNKPSKEDIETIKKIAKERKECK